MPFDISAKVRNKDKLFQKLKEMAPAVAAEVVAANEKLADEMVQTARLNWVNPGVYTALAV